MKKLFLVAVVMLVLVLSFFGCSEQSESGQNDEEEQTVFCKSEDIKAQSSPVEQAMTALLNIEQGVIVDRHQGALIFGDVTGHENKFQKLSDDKYHIICTTIDKEGNHEVVNATDVRAKNILGSRLMVEDFQGILDSTNQLEIFKEDFGSIFKYSYTLKQLVKDNSVDFVGVKGYYFYLLNSEGRLTGMEQHAIYEIVGGEEHHDFIKTTITETLL